MKKAQDETGLVIPTDAGLDQAMSAQGVDVIDDTTQETK